MKKSIKLISILLCIVFAFSAYSVTNANVGDDGTGGGSSVSDPSNDDPSNDDPSNEDPSNDDPSNDDPSNDDPSNDDPSNDDPSNDDPSNDDPSNDDPSNDDPSNDDPSNQNPSNQNPSKPNTSKPTTTKPTTSKPAVTKPNLGTIGKSAQKYFKVLDKNIRCVSKTARANEINNAANNAEIAYKKTGKAQMVYVPAGTHKINSYLSIPKGVILVSEKNCVYSITAKLPIVLWLYGSVYGGKFDGHGKAGQMIRFRETSFKWPSGYVLHTSITNCRDQAVVALGKISNVYVCNNTMKNALDGVCSIYGATINLIDNNKISYMTQSGVDVTHANVKVISNNTITNVTGHGISTDTEQNKGHAFVRITEVYNNTITGPKHHGIYLEKNCKITGDVYNNVISNATLNGVCISQNAGIGNNKKKTFFYNNIVQGSKLSNISMAGKNAILFMGSKNKVRNGKGAGIALGRYAKCYIYGKNNYISKNALNGVQMDANTSFQVRGSGRTYITNNRWGINMGNKGGAVNLKNTTIKGNKKGAAYIVKGCSLKYNKSNCSISGKIYKKK